MPLYEVILLLGVATTGLLLGRLARAPALVAYLVAGILVGPGVLGWVGHTPALDQLAELGVALLLFGVGIEFSLERMRRILGRMLASGALQVGATVGVTALLFGAVGVGVPTALLLGFIVALSSTAIVFKLYDESGEIDAPQGEAAAAILLFQDLALVPMVLLVPVLADPGRQGLAYAGSALLAAATALAVLLLVARVVLPRGLELVARANIPELFPLASLVIAFGTAAAAAQLGLSLPIGAFLAGLALSGSPYARQVFVELLPLRDAFVAIFFTSVGMLVEPAMLATDLALLGSMLAAVLIKGLLVGLVVGLLWRSARLGCVVGLGLAQIGEFSVLLAREGVEANLLDAAAEQAFLGAAILSMAATPFLMLLARRVLAFEPFARSTTDARALRDHVLVLGYGETGRALTRVLRETGIPFAVVDLLARPAPDEKVTVHFGDATRRVILEELGAKGARAAVVALGDQTSTRRAVSVLRQLNGEVRILARARRVGEIAELERLGADEVVPAEFETSIELLTRLLTRLGVPRHLVRVQESILRLDHYQALRGLGRTPELLAQTERLVMGGILETAVVTPGCAASGQTLAELDLPSRTGAQILNVVRREEPLPSPRATTRLEDGDLVVLYGPHVAIDQALHLFDPPAPE